MDELTAYKTAAEIVDLLDGWREKDSWESEWDSKEEMTEDVSKIILRRVGDGRKVLKQQEVNNK